ncbi:MAG: TIGR03986 family CRISPR-associated RAMP protein [Syntrophaceae bacterium]|nr:TIGR03986 family CRISPR-associated RAMP protein [Syntrophaceae bacterium]
MARHINPDPAAPERTATAPYNFVPLPNQIYSVEGGIDVDGKNVKLWDMHHQYVPGTHNGWIDLTIKTLTPLFIRGSISSTDGIWDSKESRFRPEPFVNKNGVPVIPGSSLRGMIRDLVEIISFSKIFPVTDERPFFRTVAPDRIGIAYRNRMIHGTKKPDGGYVRKIGNRWFIYPAVEILRIHNDTLACCGIMTPGRATPNYCPSWFGQHKTCWFKRNGLHCQKVDQLSLTEIVGWEKGVLVLTGSAPDKKYEFVFVGKDDENRIQVPESIWRRFHDMDQLTQWQEKAFPKNVPPGGGRKANGHLRDGEPVFYLVTDAEKKAENPDGLVFFGRAQMFRFPYDLSPLDLIPKTIKNGGLDVAESMFGRVGRGAINENQTIRGRVLFSDAVAQGERPDWLEDIMVPSILSSPKVTCFQHYLTQNGTRSKQELTTYLVGDHTTVRGHKHYWHRWDENQGIAKIKEVNKYNDLLQDLQKKETKKILDSQHTLIRPVKKNVVFNGRVRFENLSDIELGALLAALDLPEGCAHKLGMGKPLGLGSVIISTKLFLVDRESRYKNWEKNGVNTRDASVFRDAFLKKMIAHARNSQEVIDTSRRGLWQISRLQALFYLLGWDTKPPCSETECMPLEKFKKRLVLSSPHRVSGQQEPSWPYDPPGKGV